MRSDITEFVKRIGSLIARLPGIRFSAGVIFELRKVNWLSRNKVIRYTLLIVIFLILGSILVFLLDRLFLTTRNLII